MAGGEFSVEQVVPEGARSLIQAIIEKNSFTLGLMEGDSVLECRTRVCNQRQAVAGISYGGGPHQRRSDTR